MIPSTRAILIALALSIAYGCLHGLVQGLLALMGLAR